MHSLYAQLTVAKSPRIYHFSVTDRFLVSTGELLIPSLIRLCKPISPTHSLTLRVWAKLLDQKHTKGRGASKRPGFFFRAMIFVLISLMSPAAMAGQITVATASNFLHSLKALQQPFAKQTGHRISIVVGSSGALATQIINGAPFDVFLSADQARSRQLIDKGAGDETSLMTYAHGKLTLWSNDKTLIANGDGPAILKSGAFHHLAIANPKLAPYGLAAVGTLQSLGLHSGLENKIIYGENIAQTFTMLATGAAPIGFAARSQLARDPWKSKGSFWHVPDNMHLPIKQDAVIVKHSSNKKAARQFLDFLKSAPATAIIRSFGYGTEKP